MKKTSFQQQNDQVPNGTHNIEGKINKNWKKKNGTWLRNFGMCENGMTAHKLNIIDLTLSLITDSLVNIYILIKNQECWKLFFLSKLSSWLTFPAFLKYNLSVQLYFWSYCYVTLIWSRQDKINKCKCSFLSNSKHTK